VHLSGTNLGKISVPVAAKGHRDTAMVTLISGCKTVGCENPAVIGPSGQDVCLEHFFRGCYEQLERIEPLVRGRLVDAAEAQDFCVILEECSQRTVSICFRNEPLTNLERSRLLEILLSCRDLQMKLTKRTL
jgi:hypothetical protein